MTTGRYSRLYRYPNGRLRLPFGHLSLLLGFHGIRVRGDNRPAVENLVQFLPSVMILARRLRDHLVRYEESTWANVPFRELFLDTQAVVLFLRQFLEDVGLTIRLVLPRATGDLPASFTKLSARLRNASDATDPHINSLLPPDDPLRQFLISEERWLAELKDLRDDICHRTTYGRIRPRFPNVMDVLLSGGGKAAFASEKDLRTYLSRLFERWLALACVASDFAERRIRAEHPKEGLPPADAYVLSGNDFDAAASDAVPKRPVGTLVLTVPSNDYAAIEYFLERPAA